MLLFALLVDRREPAVESEMIDETLERQAGAYSNVSQCGSEPKGVVKEGKGRLTNNSICPQSHIPGVRPLVSKYTWPLPATSLAMA